MAKLKKRSRRRLIRTGIIGSNLTLLLVVSLFVINNRSASQTIRTSTVNSAVATVSSVNNPLDRLSSAEIAAQAAQLVRLPELTAVRNQADSENAQLAIVASDADVVAKPQIVSTSQKSRRDIAHYKTKTGDTITSIAGKFGVSANSIRWSNDLSGELLAGGRVLLIPPGDGLVYRVKATDTIDSIVNKYGADKSLFITVNDTEIGGLKKGEYVWVPNGRQQTTSFISASGLGGFSWGFDPIYGYNGYDYGYCTWYVSNRRSATGRPVPSNLGNAITWKVLAARAGFSEGTKPATGAVIWTPVSYGYGHVGIVEKMNADGSVWVSDMNSHGYASMSTSSGFAGGWGRISYRFLSPSEASNFWYIY